MLSTWGTGTARIAQACLYHGLPEQEFEASSQRFIVIFRKNPYPETREMSVRVESECSADARCAPRQEYRSIDNVPYQESFGIDSALPLVI